MKITKVLITICLFLIGSFALKGQAGDDLFDESYVHEIRLEFYDANFFNLMLQLYGEAHANGENPDYLPAAITIDGNSLDTVGVRMKGDFSYVLTDDKKPLKIDINEFVSGQKYDGLKKFNLAPSAGDPSFLREKIGYDLLASLGVIAPRIVYARIYLNDEYWGLYQIIEQVDKTFLENRFGNKDGNLFKSKGGASLTYIDDNQSTYEDEEYPSYELKTNEEENDWSDLIAFMNVLANTPDADFKNVLEDNFNVGDFLKDMAVQTYIMNNDNYFHGGNNFYMYHNTETSKWDWIPWDLNYSMTDYTGFGNDFAQPQDVPAVESAMLKEFSILTRRILENDELRDQYLNEVCLLVNGEGSIDNIHTRVDELSDAIRADVLEDTKKTYSNQDFESNIAYGSVDETFIGSLYGVKDFTEKRVGKLLSELTASGIESCMLTSTEHATYEERYSVQIHPNPVHHTLNIQLFDNKAIQAIKVSVYDSKGGMVLIHNRSFETETTIDMSGLVQGVYFMKILFADGSNTLHRVVKQ